ncbi:TadG family pilus assembly protein [Collimonas fungivorans]|uniref:Putative transmembrane protein n=1 Tax=Collimonas fungivorans (strain Ter331) TaxID=1005048 RepID=G0AIB2_COLFT|nr:pilus assembly protein TadG-related protein [Collimonas fungivorans]AEK60695.1 putative transmembrane protein [Collimonas fungivorans Ter331]
MNAFLATMVDYSSAALPRQREVRRHGGSIIVMVAIFLSIVFILASSIDIGYVFYMKRDLQKTADLAALAGALQLATTPPLGNPATCVSTDKAVLAAIGNAQANGFATTAPNQMSNAITVTCGRWDPVANAAQAPNYFAAPVAGTSLNAVKVVVAQTVPAFFGLGSRTISGQAIASGSNPTAAFSLGTGLLSLCTPDGSLSALLLNGLLGSNICLSLVSYNGLLGAQVSLLQVLANLNVDVGTIDQVANAQVTLAQLVNATIQALSPTQIGNIDLAALQTELLKLTTGTLGNAKLTIGSILNLVAANGVAALDTQINVLDLLSVGTLQVANKNNFLDLGASIPGVAGLRLKLIEPPQMAIGGKGAVATSAQLRLNLNLSVPGLLNLPLYVDLAPGKATLNSLQCSAPQSATFDVQTGLAEVCLANGQTDTSVPLTSCPDVSKPANQVNVISILGIPTVSLGINASLSNSSTPVTLNAPFPSSKTVNSSLSSILGGVLKPGNFVFGGLLSLLNPILSALDILLNPILSLVGGILDSLFSSLGLGVGQSTLKVSSISCGNVKLVY